MLKIKAFHIDMIALVAAMPILFLLFFRTQSLSPSVPDITNLSISDLTEGSSEILDDIYDLLTADLV